MVDYIIGGVIIAIVVLTILSSVIATIKKSKARAEEKTREVDDVVVKHGVRYTPDATIVDEKGNDNITYIQGDIIIKPRNKMYVGKGGIKPGKWTVLASNDATSVFNIRIGNYVQEYKHGQEIILSEGDEVCPTSTTIILR